MNESARTDRTAAITLFLIAAVLLGIAAAQARSYFTGLDGRERVRATITELRFERGQHTSSTDPAQAMPFYSYEVNGSQFIERGKESVGSRAVGEEAVLERRVGDTVTVLVDPDTPREVSLNDLPSVSVIVLFATGGLLALVGAWYLTFGRRDREPLEREAA